MHHQLKLAAVLDAIGKLYFTTERLKLLLQFIYIVVSMGCYIFYLACFATFTQNTVICYNYIHSPVRALTDRKVEVH